VKVLNPDTPVQQKPHDDRIAKQQDKELLVHFQRQVAQKFHFQLLWLKLFLLKLKNMIAWSLNQHKHKGQKLRHFNNSIKHESETFH
jgi:hypothetical protein